MLNEELALLMQAGDPAALDELTQQNRGMLYRTAYRLYMAHGGADNPYGMELEDAAQIAFVGLYGACMAYDPAKGFKLLAYLWRQTQRAFRDMYYYQRKDPLRFARSLDEPLTGGTEDLALLDTQADDSAAAAFEDCDEALYWQQAGGAIDTALATLPDRQAATLRMKYMEGKYLEAIGEQQGRSYQSVGDDINRALRKLRSDRALREYYTGYIAARAYRATGYASWLERCGSHMELLIERADATALECFPETRRTL